MMVSKPQPYGQRGQIEGLTPDLWSTVLTPDDKTNFGRVFPSVIGENQ